MHGAVAFRSILCLLEGFREHNVMATPVTIWAISQSTGHLNFRSACHGAHHGMRYCKEYLDISLLET